MPNKLNKVLFFMVILVLLASWACKKGEAVQGVKIQNPVFLPKISVGQFDSFLIDQHRLANQPAYAIAVVYKDKTIYRRFNGQLHGNRGGGKVNGESIFRIGSLSKGFSGILVAMLADKGLLNLNDPVAKYIPQLTLNSSVPGDSLRLWHILAHTTGLTEHAFSNLIEMGKSKQLLIKALNELKPRDITGQDYAYQNAAFSLIEDVIASVTGLTYNDALDAFIFKRLQMHHASSNFAGVQHNDHFVWPQHAGGALRDLDTTYYNTPSAGGINASLNDMESWVSTMMGFKTDQIAASALALAFAPRVSTAYDDKYFNFWPGVTDSKYGLGWRILTMNNRTLLFHGGQVSHYRAEIAFDPILHLGVVALFSEPCYLSNHIVPAVFDKVKVH
jgi:beta-lactamase class C